MLGGREGRGDTGEAVDPQPELFITVSIILLRETNVSTARKEASEPESGGGRVRLRLESFPVKGLVSPSEVLPLPLPTLSSALTAREDTTNFASGASGGACRGGKSVDGGKQ